MELIRSNYIKIIPKNKFEEKRIETFLKDNCVVQNPTYEKKIKYGMRGRFAIPKYIKTYEKIKESNLTYFNIMKANKSVYKKLFDLGLEIDELIDDRIENPIEIDTLLGPRDNEQEKAIKAILDNEFEYGILSAAPSSGKTFISLYCASKFKQRTLILVDMSLLMDQFVDSILKFTNIKEEEIGYIGGSKKEYSEDKKIIISTIQTLSKKENINIIKELVPTIGFIICDEVHIMSCDTAQKILKHFKPKYMLGLSGTPHRDDEMDFITSESIGPIIHCSDRNKMVESGSMITPILRPLFLKDDELFQKYNIDKEVKFRDVVDIYYNSPKVIEKISNLITYHYNNNDSQLIICKEKELIYRYYAQILINKFDKKIESIGKREQEHEISLLKEEIEFLKSEKEMTTKIQKLISKKERLIKKIKKMNWFDMPKIQNKEGVSEIKIFVGSTSREERERIIQDINDGKVKIVLATTTFDKALSAERLNILYLLFSTRERANTIQRIGRVARTHPDKVSAIVYDVIYDHYMSFYQFFNNKGDCRMNAYNQGFVRIHKSNDMLINYLASRYKQKDYRNEYEKKEWENWKSKYIIEL